MTLILIEMKCYILLRKAHFLRFLFRGELICGRKGGRILYVLILISATRTHFFKAKHFIYSKELSKFSKKACFFIWISGLHIGDFFKIFARIE